MIILAIVTLILVVLTNAKGFEVYWNVPTQACLKYGIPFNLALYNIIQNKGDKFYGNKMTIVYGPGYFPHYEGKVPVGGGIPQKANAVEHLDRFREQVIKNVPTDFNGYAVLDFESYQPYYDIAPGIYQKASMDWVRSLQPTWSNDTIRVFAKYTFDQATNYLFGILLEAGKVLRPKAKWGYYHYPYCDNPTPGHPRCASWQLAANDRTGWLFQESDALYPSIYIYKKGFDPYTRGEQVQERLTEAKLRRQFPDQPILPYFWFKYHDDTSKYLEPMDLWSTLGLAWYNKLDGAIIWGGSHDVRTKQDCIALKDYLKKTLGPFVKFLTTFR